MESLDNAKEVGITDIEDYKRYSSLGIFLVITILSFFIIKPFLVSIITAGVLAFIFHPLFLKLKRKVKKDSLSALIICLLIILAIIIPSIFFIKTLATQAIGAYASSAEYLSQTNLNSDLINNINNNFGININLNGIILSAAGFFADTSKEFLADLPNKLINFFLMVILLYYFLKSSETFNITIEKIIPFKKEIKQKILSETKEVTRAVIYGTLITAMIQGTIGAIGFWIFGISSPIFWGLLMALFALIPVIGTGIIWFPAALILIAEGLVKNQGLLIGKGIGLIIYGVLLIGLIDNFIKPKLIESKVKLHPAIILLGIIGGIPFFGIIGIFLGPLILAIFITLIKIYGEEYGV